MDCYCTFWHQSATADRAVVDVFSTRARTDTPWRPTATEKGGSTSAGRSGIEWREEPHAACEAARRGWRSWWPRCGAAGRDIRAAAAGPGSGRQRPGHPLHRQQPHPGQRPARNVAGPRRGGGRSAADRAGGVWRLLARNHLARGDAARAIAEGGWRVVILQQGPSGQPDSRVLLRRDTAAFDRLIRGARAKTALFSVWADSQGPSTFDDIRESYSLAAADVNGLYLPVNEAWTIARNRKPPRCASTPTTASTLGGGILARRAGHRRCAHRHPSRADAGIVRASRRERGRRRPGGRERAAGRRRRRARCARGSRGAIIPAPGARSCASPLIIRPRPHDGCVVRHSRIIVRPCPRKTFASATTSAAPCWRAAWRSRPRLASSCSLALAAPPRCSWTWPTSSIASHLRRDRQPRGRPSRVLGAPVAARGRAGGRAREGGRAARRGPTARPLGSTPQGRVGPAPAPRDSGQHRGYRLVLLPCAGNLIPASASPVGSSGSRLPIGSVLAAAHIPKRAGRSDAGGGDDGLPGSVQPAQGSGPLGGLRQGRDPRTGDRTRHSRARPVRKPALLRQVFALCASSPAQIVSLQKLQGQLQDAGALETIAHYLSLLEEAFLVAALEKHSLGAVRRRAPPPSWSPYNALLAVSDPRGAPDQARRSMALRSVGGERLSRLRLEPGQRLTYWREEPYEVDAILEGSCGRWAIEVKTGTVDAVALRELGEFTRRFPSDPGH